MLTILSKLCEEEKFVSIYTNLNDTSRFIFGKILGLDDDFFAIYSVSPDGEFDGIIVKEIKTILRLELNTQYCKKMESLISFNELPILNYDIKNEKILESFLRFAAQTNEVISLELLNSEENDLIGFIELESLNKNFYKINQIDCYGHPDGCSLIPSDNITGLSYLSKNEINIKKLFNFIKL